MCDVILRLSESHALCDDLNDLRRRQGDVLRLQKEKDRQIAARKEKKSCKANARSWKSVWKLWANCAHDVRSSSCCFKSATMHSDGIPIGIKRIVR